MALTKATQNVITPEIVTKDTSQTITGTKTFSTTIIGNTDTSTKLLTARTINGIAFDGTADITIPASGSSSAKAWVNFNGDAASYTTLNTVSYAANSPSAGQTTVTVDRAATWSPLPSVGDWITVSGVTGATGVNGTYQITQVDNVAFNIKYIVPSVVTGTVAGTAIVYVVAIRSSYNVSSVTKNAISVYTINFSTPMADANYTINGSLSVLNQNTGDTSDTNASVYNGSFAVSNDTVPTTTSCKVLAAGGYFNGNRHDNPRICAAIFGN